MRRVGGRKKKLPSTRFPLHYTARAPRRQRQRKGKGRAADGHIFTSDGQQLFELVLAVHATGRSASSSSASFDGDRQRHRRHHRGGRGPRAESERQRRRERPALAAVEGGIGRVSDTPSAVAFAASAARIGGIRRVRRVLRPPVRAANGRLHDARHPRETTEKNVHAFFPSSGRDEHLFIRVPPRRRAPLYVHSLVPLLTHPILLVHPSILY